MKDWLLYIKDHLNSDLWGFVLLDYYRKKEADGEKETPSKFIDRMLMELIKHDIDPVKFHHVLLSVNANLFGSDLPEMMNKSIFFLRNLKISQDQLNAIISQYDIYGKSEIFKDKIKSDKIQTIDAPMKKGDLFEMHGIKLFYSYAHEDEKLRNKLEEHLSILKRNKTIDEFHDRKILPGSEFSTTVDDNIRKSKIILLLVSSSFINSDYCYGKEMTLAIEMHDRKEATVIPIILRDCTWHSAPFGKLLALPTDGKPVTGKRWKNRDEAFTDIAKGITKVAEEQKKLKMKV